MKNLKRVLLPKKQTWKNKHKIFIVRLLQVKTSRFYHKKQNVIH